MERLQVAPTEIEFGSVETDVNYVAVFHVRNNSTKLIRYRVEPPSKASRFKVLLNNRDIAVEVNATIKLPPGITTTYQITFEHERERPEPLLDSVHDLLLIKEENQSPIEVPLFARRACPDIDIEPSRCDVGLVVMMQRSAAFVKLRNAGSRTGKFMIDMIAGDSTSEGNGQVGNTLTVNPEEVVLAPDERVSIKVDVLGQVLGSFRRLLRVRVVESQTSHNSKDAETGWSDLCKSEKFVDVRGKVVSHTMELLATNSKQALESIYFGSLFAGEKRTIHAVLRNNGPQPLSFDASISFSSSGTKQVDEDRATYERRKELQISPAHGKIEPFAEVPVSFSFSPKAVEWEEWKKRQWEHQKENDTLDELPPSLLQAFMSIQCTVSHVQNLTLEVSGKRYLPKITLSPDSCIDFGDVASHDRADMLVQIKNLSGLPVRFVLRKIAHFSCKPASGRLDVLQSQSLVISFTPTQLGTFSNVLNLVVNQTVLSIPISVKGRATIVGEVDSHKPLVGGVQALPEDFTPAYKFIQPEDAKKTRGALSKRFNRIPFYEKAALTSEAVVNEFEVEAAETGHLTYSVKELAKKSEHREKYRSFLEDRKRERDAKAQEKKERRIRSKLGITRSINAAMQEAMSNNDDELAVQKAMEGSDLGIARQSGLEPKELTLPRELKTKMEPLWLHESAFGLTTKVYFDENKFVKKKFKAQPTTQAERSDCEMQLEFEQLERVLSGPSTIHFGKISVNSIARKSLTVHNKLPSYILVALHLSVEDQLEEIAVATSLKSQVIPPRSSAGFDIGFRSTHEQVFQKQLTYSINGAHLRRVTAVAEVAPITVQLSTNELEFAFNVLDTNPTMSMALTVTNPSDSCATFMWKNITNVAASIDDKQSVTSSTTSLTRNKNTAAPKPAPGKPVYQVLPASGELAPGASMKLQVEFTPPPCASTTPYNGSKINRGDSAAMMYLVSDFEMQVEGGRPVQLSCKSQLSDAKVDVKEKKLDFGNVPVGIATSKKLCISNSSRQGTRSTYYVTLEPNTQATSLGFTLSKAVGSVSAQDTSEIYLELTPKKPFTLDETALYLQVQFRGGKSVKVPLHAVALVPDVCITPTEQIDFGRVVIGTSISRVLSLENSSPTVATLALDLRKSLSDEFAVSMPPHLLEDLEDASSVFIPLEDKTAKEGSSDSVSASTKWQICIPPNVKVSLQLTFTPTTATSHFNPLPLQFTGSQSVQWSRPPAIARQVSAEAVDPILLFSCANINFHRCVVTQEGIRKVPYTKQLVLTNNSDRTLQWEIELAKLKALQGTGHVIFHMAPTSGELAKGEEVFIRTSFLPMEEMEYLVEGIPLLVEGQSYIDLSLCGEGIHPHLSFSVSKVELPPVPLGIPSQAVFILQSIGYDHLDVTYRLPMDLSKAPVTLHFPKGKILSMAHPALPVEVRLLSKTSVAFNARIEFFDSDGNCFPLPLSGSTENCLLSNYSFLQSTSLHQDDADACKRDHLSSKFCFLTHPSGEYPIYLVSEKQWDKENGKQVKINTKGLEHRQSAKSQTLKPQPMNGFIDVDCSDMLEDVSSNTASALPLSPVRKKMTMETPTFSQQEIVLLIKYLNANFVTSQITKFPHDFAENHGKPLYEMLSMVCPKKPPMGAKMSKQAKNVKVPVTTAPQSKKDVQNKVIAQYASLLKFLKPYGAMLHDIMPGHLLPQDLYVRACEDPAATPGLLSSPALLAMRYEVRRQVLEKEWLDISTSAWMKVIYQVIKCFVLSRITADSYTSQLQEKILSNKQHRHFDGSNIYSEGEMVLIQWICDHVRDKAATLESIMTVPSDSLKPEVQLLDIRNDLQDARFLFYLLAAHIPTIRMESREFQSLQFDVADLKNVKDRFQKSKLSQSQLQQNAQVLLRAFQSTGVDFGLDPSTFLATMNGREMLLLLLHLKQVLPQFVPRATISFQGLLGTAIKKKIELTNPSHRTLVYQASLDQTGGSTSGGSLSGGLSVSDIFQIETTHIVLEPQKAKAFVVTCHPRFSRKMCARLVFQAVPDGSDSTAASGSTMVFLLETDVSARKPVRTIQVDAKLYERKVEELVIENQFASQGNFRLSMTQVQTQQASSPFDAARSTLESSRGSVVANSKPASRGSSRRGKRGTIARGSMIDVNVPLSNLSTKKESAGTDTNWCISAYLPFFLPDYRDAGSNASNATSSSAIAMSGRGSGKIKLEFLPLILGQYKCQLLFLDEQVGEFMYEIHGVGHLPLPLERLEFQCELPDKGQSSASALSRGQFLREVFVPTKNAPLSKVLPSVVDRFDGLVKSKWKAGLKSCEDEHHTNFKIEFNSPFFTPVYQEVVMSSAPPSKTHPSRPNVNTIGLTESDSARLESGSEYGGCKTVTGKANHALVRTPNSSSTLTVSTPNTALLRFEPKAAGVYTCKLALKSQHTCCGSVDYRVYDVVATVKEPNVKTHLEFVSPARQSILQDIPLSNPSDTTWTLKATFKTESSENTQDGTDKPGANDTKSMFSGPSSLLVPPRKTVSYPLSFTPRWISNQVTTFVLQDPATQQQFEFELNGIGDAPLALDHVSLSCQARTSIVHEFIVTSFADDPPGSQTYEVDSDLRDIIGNSTVKVPNAGKSVKYPLTFTPRVSGIYSGSITFTNTRTKEYMWYTIEALVSAPDPERTLEMKTAVREMISVEIRLVNPLETAVEFTIDLQGDGLLGLETFSMTAKGEGIYELMYSPLHTTDPDKPKEGAIQFSNHEIGQFWYRLLLSADMAEPQATEDMCCAVGDVCTQPIILQNPSDQEIHLSYRISNTRNFSIKGSSSGSNSSSQQPRIPIAPFGETTVLVEYTPSSLSEFETSSIVFDEPGVVSDWEYLVRGKGKAPSVMKPINMSTKVHEVATIMFPFKNPFASIIKVDVTLTIDHAEDKERPIFDVLLKKKENVHLNSFTSLQVPIVFTPEVVCEAHGMIYIRGREEYCELEWKYPVYGVAEAPLHPRAFVLACPARESIEKDISCELMSASPSMQLENESFTVEWDIPVNRFGPLASKEALEQTLVIQPNGQVGRETSATPRLNYKIRFDPLRPYRGSIYLIIRKRSGGFWRFEVQLDVSDPPVDDYITIESSLNQTSSISFQLRNQFRQPAPFFAEFSAGSSSAFTVFPAEGELPPYGSVEGQNFVISFTPTAYGKMQSGQLLITTDEMLWNFIVKGGYPEMTSNGNKAPTSALTSTSSKSRN